MSKRRERRSAAQAARRAARRGCDRCDVPYCAEYGKNLGSCAHTMCDKCIFNSIGATDYDELQPRFSFRCAICRFRYRIAAETMKHSMTKFVSTTRCKEVECCCPDDCGKTYMITHRACSLGCFDCPQSALVLDVVAIHGLRLDAESESEGASERERTSDAPLQEDSAVEPAQQAGALDSARVPDDGRSDTSEPEIDVEGKRGTRFDSVELDEMD